MMLDLDELLRGVVLPGALVVVALSLGWRVWRRGESPTPRWVNGVTLGIAFAAGLLAINRVWPTLPPRGYRDWLVLLGPLLGGLTLLLPLAARAPRIAVRPVRLLLLSAGAALAVGVIVSGRSHAFGPYELWTWLLVAFLCTYVAMLSADAIAPRLPTWTLSLVLTLYVAVGAWLLGVGGSRLLAQYGGALATTTAATFLFSLLLRRFTLAGGGAAVLVAMQAALLLVGVLFSEMPRYEATLLLLGPVALWIGLLLPPRLGWQRLLVALLGGLLPLAVVAVLGAQRFLAVLREAAELGY